MELLGVCVGLVAAAEPPDAEPRPAVRSLSPVPAGTGTSARQSGPRSSLPRCDNLIDWKGSVPRLAAVYDVTGTGTTLAKFAFAQYRGAERERCLQREPERGNGGRSTHGRTSTAAACGSTAKKGARRRGAAVSASNRWIRLWSCPFWTKPAPGSSANCQPSSASEPASSGGASDQHFARQNANQPFDAFTVPVSIRDPGPDGDGGHVG